MRRTKGQVKVAAALMANPDARHYGYPLSRAAGVRSGVLYPMLRRLEEAGLIVGAWEAIDPEQAGRPPRRYYTVTPAGRVALAALLVHEVSG